MAIDTSTLEATLQTKFDNVTDPKEMLLLGKAYEATVGGIAVSDIEAAGAAQVATINSVATSTFKTIDGNSILGSGDIDIIPSQTGYAGKVLKTDGTNVSWGQGGGLIKTTSYQDNTEHQINAGGWVWWHYSTLNPTYTMVDSSNDLIVTFNIHCQSDNHQGSILFQYLPAGGSWTDFPGTNSTGTAFGSVHGEIYASQSYGKVTHIRQFKISPNAASVELRILVGQDGGAGTVHHNHNNGNTGIGSNGSSSITVMEVVV